MLRISYAGCPWLCVVISTPFALETCVTAQNRPKKSTKTLLWHSRSFKVIYFGANWQPVYDFLLVINSNLGPISNRCWNTATYRLKIANFPTPSHLAPRSGWPLSNFWKSFTNPKTRVFQAADSDDLVTLACTIFDWSTRVTAGQTDRQTDRIVMAKTCYSSSCCRT